LAKCGVGGEEQGERGEGFIEASNRILPGQGREEQKAMALKVQEVSWHQTRRGGASCGKEIKKTWKKEEKGTNKCCETGVETYVLAQAFFFRIRSRKKSLNKREKGKIKDKKREFIQVSGRGEKTWKL